MAYSVLSEPIIPIETQDGQERNVGIRAALLQAHEIKDIAKVNPLERYAILRLLIAFAMDMMNLQTSYDRMNLLEKGKFEEEQFEQYVKACEKEGPRFDLFDMEHPFLQSAYDEKLDAKARKPAAILFHALPSGNNHVFIDHRMAGDHQFSIPEAFRAMCASYVFCVSGTAGPSSVNNTPPLFAIILRQNLFETIVINMISRAEAAPLPYGIGETAWRKERTIKPKEQIATVSLLEGLTWMPRRITLIKDHNDMICEVYCQAGLDFRGNDLWNDPHVPRFKKKDGTYGNVKPEIGREVWRDAGSLLYDHDEKYARQPLAIKCLRNIFEDDEMPVWLTIRTEGLLTNQAAYTGWCESELSIPTLFLYDEAKASMLRRDIALIETVQSSVFRNVQKYVDKPRSSSTNEEHGIASQCQQYFLKSAHDWLFGDDIHQILICQAEHEHGAFINDALRKMIKDMFKHILYSSGNSTEEVLRQIEAEKWIWRSLTTVLEERVKENA